MDSAVMLAQVPVEFGSGQFIDGIIKVGFAAVVAWYLLTQTTNAIKGLRDEVASLRQEITVLRTDLARGNQETHQEVHEINDAIKKAMRG